MLKLKRAARSSRAFSYKARLSLVVLILSALLGIVAVLPVFAAGDPDVVLTLTHDGTTTGENFFVGVPGGKIIIAVENIGTSNSTTDPITIENILPPGLTFNSLESSLPGGLFTCSGTTTVTCSTTASLAPSQVETITFSVDAGPPIGGPYTNEATITSGDSDPDAPDNTFSDPQPFSVVSYDLAVSISHVGAPAPSTDFQTGSTTGSVTAQVRNEGNNPSPSTFNMNILLQGGLVANVAPASTPVGYFSCIAPIASLITCTANSVLAPGASASIFFTVTAPGSPQPGPFVNQVYLSSVADFNPSNDVASDPQPFSIVGAGAPSATPTVTPTRTALPTLPPPPTSTPQPQPTIPPTRTLIPPLPTRTPLPRPANAGQAIPIPPSGVSVVTNRDGVNVRIYPAIGAPVLGFVNAGTLFENVQARSGDSQWVRVNFAGQQGWIGFPVISVVSGDVASLPVGDPRTIPYGGFEQPRAGITSVTSPLTGRLAMSGLRIRSGPSIGYAILANAPRYTVFPLLGRTADNTWLQVNFEGTLGWVAAQYVELSSPDVFTQLPVDGIIADGLPVSAPVGDSYIDTLKLMLARVDIALESLNAIRAIWTNAALGNPIQCGSYPPRPTDFNIPQALLAAFNDTLGPLQADFNAAAARLREAIDALIQSCSFGQPQAGLIGEGAIAVALQAVNEADGIFASLRRRLLDLIPEERVPTDDECLFTFDFDNEIVTRLRPGQAMLVTLPEDLPVLGFCFDGTIGETYRIEVLRVTGFSEPQVVVGPFSQPTNFLAVGRMSPDSNYVALTNILIPATEQYLVIVSDLVTEPRSEKPGGEFAILLTNTTGISGFLAPGLALDPATGQVIVNPTLDQIIAPTPIPGVPTPLPPISVVTCPNITFTCAQLLTCEQARACLAAGNTSLDLDNDGVPCEENLCAGTGG